MLRPKLVELFDDNIRGILFSFPFTFGPNKKVFRAPLKFYEDYIPVGNYLRVLSQMKKLSQHFHFSGRTKGELPLICKV